MTSSTLNPTVLEPLFAPWAEPNAHRVRAEKSGDPAVVKQGRRASPIEVVNNLRAAVREWREAFYIGASDTTIQLLNHWFNRAHRKTTPESEEFEFRYYFCQREAVETLIYLKEVRRIECLSQIIAEFGGVNAELQALGITEDEDTWSRPAGQNHRPPSGDGTQRRSPPRLGRWLCLERSHPHPARNHPGSQRLQAGGTARFLRHAQRQQGAAVQTYCLRYASG